MLTFIHSNRLRLLLGKEQHPLVAQIVDFPLSGPSMFVLGLSTVREQVAVLQYQLELQEIVILWQPIRLLW